MEDLRMISNTSKCEITWEMPNFSSLPATPDFSVESPLFTIADATWSLILYPNKPREKVCISLNLVRLESYYTNHMISFEIDLKEDFAHTFSSEDIVIIEDNIPVELTSKFNIYDGTDDSTPVNLRSGSLTLIISLKMDADEMKKEIEGSSLWGGYAKLSQDLQNLLLSQIDSDVTIRVKGQEFLAHTPIIGARSPILANMLKNEMKEKDSRVVEIKDLDPKVFGPFLSFLYTGLLKDLSVENVYALYVAADKYNIVDLKSRCVKLMKGTLSVDTFCDIAAMCFKNKETELLKEAISYFAQHGLEILKSVKWLTFLKENPVESTEILTKSWQKKFSKHYD